MSGRGAVAAALLLGMAMPPAAGRADVLGEIPESMGLVPGAALAAPAETTFDAGASQLLTFAAAQVTWARLRLPVRAGWGVELLGARLHAGAWREDRQQIRLAMRGSRASVALSAALVRARLQDWVDERHGRGWMEAAYRFGPAVLGMRWEGPWRDAVAWRSGSVQVHVAIEGPGWAAGLWRPRPSHAAAAAWGAGFAARLHEQLRLGLRLRAERAEMLAWVSAGSWRVSLVLPVASLVGAGPTVSVGWTP